MGWVFLIFVVAAVLNGALCYLCFKSSPGHGSGAIGSGFAGIFFGLLCAGGVLGSAITGALTLISLALPPDVNVNAWGATALIVLGAAFGITVLVQRDIMERYPNSCHVSALLYYPFMAVSAICLFSGLVLGAIAAIF